ncbi:MAG: aminotransferase class IV family protein [Pseudomonadota bacterium]
MEDALRDPGLTLIETLFWDGTAIRRLDRHLGRARSSAAALGFRWDGAGIAAALDRDHGPTPLRLRLTVARDGTHRLTSGPLPPAARSWTLALSPERLDPDDPRLRHKTSDRGLYDRTRAALAPGIDEVIFANRRGELCEGTITSLFFDTGEGLRTPPLGSGCLPGILRAELLDGGDCREAIFPLADLPRARLWVGNSLRGLIAARLTPDGPTDSGLASRGRAA